MLPSKGTARHACVKLLDTQSKVRKRRRRCPVCRRSKPYLYLHSVKIGTPLHPPKPYGPCPGHDKSPLCSMIWIFTSFPCDYLHTEVLRMQHGVSVKLAMASRELSEKYCRYVGQTRQRHSIPFHSRCTGIYRNIKESEHQRGPSMSVRMRRRLWCKEWKTHQVVYTTAGVMKYRNVGCFWLMENSTALVMDLKRPGSGHGSE